MHYKKAFPSKWLQTSDLEQPLIVTLARITTEQIGVGADAEEKPVAHFKEPGAKGLILNVTKSEAIADIAGDPDMETWPGTRLQLSQGTTRYQGRRVGCIVVGAPPKNATSRRKTGASPDLDDVVPPSEAL